MKLLQFTDNSGRKVTIVAEKITGFVDCESIATAPGSTFIATGADGADGGENGWYVAQKYDTVVTILRGVE